ncbi:MAG TPA: ABC transporter substrate-binding protein [Alphaproteobacteria bacterium]|nr:ABC transporter substrate-binding protein [Alphaproteobacteria bacterium]
MKSRALCVLAIMLAVGVSFAMPSQAGQPGPTSGTITIALGSEPTTLDPQLRDEGPLRYTLNQVYESLVERDPKTMEIVPELAEKWTLVDKTTWRFHLRKGVKFHDGELFNAETAAFAFNRAVDPKYASQYASYWVGFKEAKVVDEHTIDIITSEPVPNLLGGLYFLKMVPKKWVEANPERILREANGTGPYKLVSFAKGDKMTLTVNPQWWGDLSALPAKDVVFLFRPEDGVRLSTLKAGEADLAHNIGADLAKLAPKFVHKAALEVFLIRLNYKTNACQWLNDVEVRQALNYAIDRNGIVKSLFQGLATPAYGQPFMDAIPGFNKDLQDYPYELAKAKEIIKRKGLEGREIELMGLEGRWVKDRELTEVLAAQLSQTGLKVKPRIIEYRTWLDNLFAVSSKEEAVRERAPCLQLTNHSNEAMDANRTLSFYVWSEGRASGRPYLAEIDDVIVANRSELDAQKRAETYRKLMKTLYDGAHAYVALFAVDAVHGLSERLIWEPRLDDLVYVKEMRLKP